MSVSRSQRWTKTRRCPKCGGCESDPRGAEKRCLGFLMQDGNSYVCTREESPIRVEGPTEGWVHRLEERRREEPEAVYSYRDEQGAELFQVVRFPGKKIRQRRHDPGHPDSKADGFVWSLGDVRRVLYRLPELVAADPARRVWIVEGEKDVDTLVARGEIATCNPHGAGPGKWERVESIARKVLAGRDVTVIADADEEGRSHGARTADSLARSVKSIALAECTHGKDITDHLASGGTLDELTPVIFRVDDISAEHTPEPPPGFDDEPEAKPPEDLHAAPDVERHVVAAALWSRECLAVAVESVELGHFTDARLVTIWGACLEANGRGMAADPLTISEMLRGHGKLDEVGGRDFLIGMANGIAVHEPTPDQIADHAKILKAKAWERRAISAIKLGASELEQANGTTPALVQRLASVLADCVAELSAESQLAPSRPSDVIARWKEEGPYRHEETGMPELDKRSNGGLVYGKPTIVQGPPNSGKTLWVAEIADTMNERGLMVGILAIDEHADAIVTRLLQRRGWLREQCEARVPAELDEMSRDLEAAGIVIYDHEYTIETAAADLAKRAGPRAPLLCVDSMQTVECDVARSINVAGRETNLRLKIVENCKAIRKVAQAHRMLLVATSEMNRAAYKTKNEEERPDDMTAGKESGSLEYTAGLLITLRSVKDEGDLIEENLTKNKIGNWPDHRGPEDTIWLRLDRTHQRVTERDAANARPSMQALHLARVRADAALVAIALVEEPGLNDQELEDTLRARHAGFASKRRGPGLAVLRKSTALVERKGRKGSLRRYLDGSRLPPDVLSQVPAEQRSMVASSRAPELDPDDDDAPNSDRSSR